MESDLSSMIKTIVVLPCKSEKKMVVSHGVDIETDKIVILPTEDWEQFKSEHCHFRQDLGEWVLKDLTPSVPKKSPLYFFS